MKSLPLDVTLLEGETSQDNEVVEIKLLDRNGKPYKQEDGSPAVAGVLGEYSDKVKELKERRGKKRRKLAAAGEELEDSETVGNEILAVATVYLKIALGGKQVEDTHENRLAIYKAAPWITNKIAIAMRERSLFFDKEPSA